MSPRHPIAGPVLLTGASGFIGRRLRDALLREGVDVVAIRRASSPEPSAGRSVVADYADQARLDEIVGEERPSHVLHVAGATKGVTYADFQRANVLPTRNLLAACENAGHTPERFVLMSSLAAYGPTTKARPLVETDPRSPVEHYGASKKEAEEALEAGPVPYTILRPGGVYGPGDVDYFEIFKLAAKGWSTFFGNRHRAFSAVYVDDLVDATLAAASHPGAKNRGYFVSAGPPVTWETFHRAVAAACGRPVKEIDLPEALVSVAAFGGELMTRIDRRPRLFNRQKAKMGAQEAWAGDASALARDIGFAPRFDLETGVARALEWYRTEGWL